MASSTLAKPVSSATAPVTTSSTLWTPGFIGVAAVVQTGWRRTTPAVGYFNVSLPSAGSVTGRNYGNTRKPLVQGSAFNDLNGNGVKDAGEAGSGNVRIFLDTDKDGVWDTTERSLLTDAG